MKRFFNHEVKIALTAIVAVCVLFYGIKFLKGLPLFDKTNSYYITFDNISGMSVSSPVFADGYKVGVVSAIDYDYQQTRDIVVKVDISKDLRIPFGTTASLSSDMLGSTKVNLLLANNPTRRHEEGDTLAGGIDGGALGQVAGMVPAIQDMLPKLDSILVSINMLLADPAMTSTLHNVEHLTASLDRSAGQLNTLMTGLNREVPGMLTKANGVLDNTNTLTSNLSQLDVAATMARVNETLDNVRKVTDKINRSEGSLGLLINDKSMYQNLNSTMSHADSLLIDLKANPKRYVRLSLF